MSEVCERCERTYKFSWLHWCKDADVRAVLDRERAEVSRRVQRMFAEQSRATRTRTATASYKPSPLVASTDDSSPAWDHPVPTRFSDFDDRGSSSSCDDYGSSGYSDSSSSSSDCGGGGGTSD